ncbi:hypothetical protein B0H11DRAFT_2021918 [Mycena galericulata]|nr:hypothetical protein B0H11DRAFT_2021918 [Mycena galericulata]
MLVINTDARLNYVSHCFRGVPQDHRWPCAFGHIPLSAGLELPPASYIRLGRFPSRSTPLSPPDSLWPRTPRCPRGLPAAFSTLRGVLALFSKTFNLIALNALLHSARYTRYTNNFECPPASGGSSARVSRLVRIEIVRILRIASRCSAARPSHSPPSLLPSPIRTTVPPVRLNGAAAARAAEFHGDELQARIEDARQAGWMVRRFPRQLRRRRRRSNTGMGVGVDSVAAHFAARRDEESRAPGPPLYPLYIASSSSYPSPSPPRPFPPPPHELRRRDSRPRLALFRCKPESTTRSTDARWAVRRSTTRVVERRRRAGVGVGVRHGVGSAPPGVERASRAPACVHHTPSSTHPHTSSFSLLPSPSSLRRLAPRLRPVHQRTPDRVLSSPSTRPPTPRVSCHPRHADARARSSWGYSSPGCLLESGIGDARASGSAFSCCTP